MEYDWPGNVRELENLIKRMVVLGNEAPILKSCDSTCQGVATGPPCRSGNRRLRNSPLQPAVPALR